MPLFAFHIIFTTQEFVRIHLRHLIAIPSPRHGKLSRHFSTPYGNPTQATPAAHADFLKIREFH
jgi:hypothetical protein